MTGYAPVNTWDTVNDPYRWQPLCVPTPPPGATEQGDLNGRTLGAQVGTQVWNKAQGYFNGTA